MNSGQGTQRVKQQRTKKHLVVRGLVQYCPAIEQVQLPIFFSIDSQYDNKNICGGHLTHILAEMMNMMALTSFAHIMAASFESSKNPPNGEDQVFL